MRLSLCAIPKMPERGIQATPAAAKNKQTNKQKKNKTNIKKQTKINAQKP
jgi:hypothetical protein